MFRISSFADEISPDINVQIKVLKDLGIKYVELRSVWDRNVLDLTDGEAAEVKRVFDENGIAVSSIGSPLGKIDVDDDFEAHLEKLYRAIWAAKFFGTGYIRVFSFYHKGKTFAESREKTMRRLEVMTGVAKRHGVILCHENEAAIYGEKGAENQELLEHMNDANFRAVLDPANYVLAGERAYECLMREHNFIEYLHIKDAHFGGEICPAGRGDGQVMKVLDFLRYRDGMFLTLEPHLSLAGSMRGFSGPELFKVAHDALTELLDELEIEYQ